MSVSEMEDDTTSVSKEQIYQAFRKAQVRYHKYRGRYTDLSNHYRELERENSKMKSILVETQDKALRRVSELKEQCNLEKSAKAHLENALRVELDEKQYVIDSLRQKVQLLDQNSSAEKTAEEHGIELSVVIQDLDDARVEIEKLNAKLDNNKGQSEIKERHLQETIDELKKQRLSENKLENSSQELQRTVDNLRKTLEEKILEITTKENSEIELKQMILDLQDALNAENAELVQLTVERTAEINELQEKLRKAADTIEKNARAAEDSNTKHILEISTLKERLDAQNLDLERLRNTLEEKNLQLEEIIAQEKENSFILAQNKMDLHEELRQRESELVNLQKQIDTLRRESAEISAEKQLTEQELVKIRKETKQGIIHLQEKMMEKETNWNLEREKLAQDSKYEGYEKETEKLKTVLTNLNREIDVFRQDAEENLLKMAETDGTLESAKATLKERNEFIQNLETQMQQCQDENARLEDENANASRKVTEMENILKESKERSSDVIKNYQTQVEQFNRENNEQKSSIETVKTHLEVLEGKLRSSAVEIATLETNMKNVTEENLSLTEKLNAEIKTSEETLKTCEAERENLLRQNEELNRRKTHLDAENQTMETNLKQANEEKQKLVEELRKERETNEETESKCRESREALKVLETEKKSLLLEKQAFDKRKANFDVEYANLEGELKTLKEETPVLKERLEMERKANEELKSCLENVRNALSLPETEEEQLLQDCRDLILREMDLEAKNAALNNDNSQFNEKLVFLSEKQETLARENEHLKQDYENLMVENSSLAKFQSKFEAVTQEKLLLETEINSLRVYYENETLELTNRLENATTQITTQNTQLNDLESEIEIKSRKLTEISLKFEQLEKQLQLQSETESVKNTDTDINKLQMQLHDTEHQLMEIINEKQLLQDEINEMKISPIQNSEINNYAALRSEYEKTLLEFRTMEETNKSTITFYETMVEKLRNKNEKLLRKLDETLVTLSHFSELNGSTEIEYLRNVLYNYMLGKESLVLARVIAAVCKFDPVQTETVLQKEQQKQTLVIIIHTFR